MARTPQVTYWASRGGYGCWVRGVQTILAKGPKDEPFGPTYTAARRRFDEILSLSNADRAGGENTVRTILELYGRELEGQGREKTLTLVKQLLGGFCEQYGHMKVCELKVCHVRDWLDGKATWNETSQATALSHLKVAFNWALDQEYITRHCLQRKRVKKVTTRRSRGAKAYLTPDECSRVLAGSTGGYRDLLRFLHGTGCRPGEAYHLEARHYVPEDACFVYRHDPGEGEFRHKTARRTKKDRVIYLTPGMVALVEGLVKQRPTGLLFRNRFNNAYNNFGVADYLRKLAKKVGLKKRLTAYSMRHTYATEFLKRGGSIKILAELLGTSVEMLDRHYGHLETDRKSLRASMLRIMVGGNA
jgi:integrase